MFDRVTPLILTYNEAPNIDRVLDRLTWAKRVVILDSYSDDETESIVRRYPNVSFYQRRFDTHANQWNFGLRETAIDTTWVLALDADFVVSEAFVQELRSLNPDADMAGFSARFRYCVEGVPLHGTAYTPVTVLYRREKAAYVQQGHTQRIRVNGKVAAFRALIHHDDRKSLDRWMASQINYMKLEAEKLAGTPIGELDAADKVRRLVVVAPAAMLFYCLIIKRTIFNGRRGVFYACQRAVAEAILSLFLLEKQLRG